MSHKALVVIDIQNDITKHYQDTTMTTINNS
jgi:nicotinamidase-related amidase